MSEDLPTTAANSRARVDFLGITFDQLTMQQTLELLRSRPAGAPFRFIVTPNVDHVVKLLDKGPAYDDWRAAYQAAALRLCDSRILKRLGRLRGIDLPLVPGSDLTVRLFHEVVADGDRIAIVGSSEEALQILRERFPKLRFEQHIPPMGVRRNPAAIEAAADFIAGQRARFTLLAVGAPQQEMIATAAMQRNGAIGTGLCVGASIDFLTGLDRRAPRLVQRLGLEWAHRLLSNPQRLWRRYLVEGPRIFLLAARWKGTGPGD